MTGHVRVGLVIAAHRVVGNRAASDENEQECEALHVLTSREVAYLREREWARTSEDILWRRTKLGLYLTPVFYVVIRSIVHRRTAQAAPASGDRPG